MKFRNLTGITALAGASFLFLTGCGSGGSTSAAVPVDVYIAGNLAGSAVYWKNGQETVVQSNAVAYTIAVSGSDVYVGGASYGPNGSVATIWKNGTATTLSSDISRVNGIAVANGTVYAVGNDQTTDYAMLWTNGEPSQLLDGMTLPHPNIPNFTFAYSISVSGSDVYVAGAAQKFFQTSSNGFWVADDAVYWKNGVAVDLTQVSNQSPNVQAASIAISGSDVYVAGNIQSSAPQAVYWKNAAQIPLANANFKGTYAGSIAVSGSNVYVAGNTDNDALGYWTNETPTVFGYTSATQPTQIAVNGTDVYVVGDSTEYAASGGPPFFATYWKNGTLTRLTPLSEPSDAAAIALVPQQ